MTRKEEVHGLVSQLREAIRRSGHSLNQIEKASGIGRDRISRFMRGERDLTLEAAGKICLALHLRLVGEPRGRKGEG